MNERVMQFRIGMFVIVAGLVLTMLIVWFGESPSLFREHVFVVVHYKEAPGVAEGIPVRKSGIRIGEVSSIAFDERPGKADGVLVTISLDRKYKVRAGAVPRLSRSLIGDVTIDMQPGEGPGYLPTGRSPVGAPIIEGDVAPDPSRTLQAATQAFERVGETLESIDRAAKGIAKVSEGAQGIGEFVQTWNATGKKVASAADGIDRFIKSNEQEFPPAVANLRELSEKFNKTFDAQTQASLRTGIDRFSTASARADAGLKNLAPLLKDLGSPVTVPQTTDFGQAMRRLNIMTTDLSLLTRQLNDGKGGLNTQGSLQKLVTTAELYENMNRAAVTMGETFGAMKPLIAMFRIFAEKVSRDPSAISRGALSR